MQLAHEPVWYFIFGPKQKSSLASQYALEHHLQHLVNPSETTLHEHEKKGLIVEGSTELFRAVEKWKAEITVIFVRGEYSEEEKAVKREYEMIGRAKFVGEASYAAFRKELYPQLIVLYGPSQVVLEALYKNYFCYIGYQLIHTPVTANDLISRYAKHENYILVEFVPEPAEVAILETYFHLKIVHLKHERTELAGSQDYFDREAAIVPALQKKPCFYSVSGQQHINAIIGEIGKKLLPELIYANVHEADQREIVRKYVEETDGLLLNIFDIQPILRRKPNKGKEPEKMEVLCSVVFRNLNRHEIIFTDFPWTPEEFYEFEGHTRSFKLFADFVKPEHYQFSKSANAAIYFLEKLKRRQIEPDIPFGTQLKTFRKYLFVTGAPCAGKTTAARYIASEFGYRHIEYEPYLASIKEKLIAPEDGEELPFRKIIAHFNTLVQESGNSPLVIDGINLDLKEVDNWVKVVGPPTVLNLKVEEKELIRRTRRKNEADLNAEVGEEEAAKIKESIAKNADWTDQFANKSPLSRLYQIDFNQQMLIAEELLKDLLQPRVYLIEENNTLLYQNLAIRHNFGFFNLLNFSFRAIGDLIRTGHYRDVIICNYRQINDDLISKDFHWLEKNIGIIRYLSIWSGEEAESKDEILHLERPPQAEKPKPAEGEEQEAPPAEDGEAKKKAFDIYDYTWTKPGNHKNMSQWFFKEKRDPVTHINTFNEIAVKGLGFSIEHLAKRRENEIFHKVTA